MDKIKNQEIIKTCEELINEVYDLETIDKRSQVWIKKTIKLIEEGQVRVATKQKNKWIINEWVKKAILLYFKIQEIKTIEIGPLEFYDKIPLKRGFENKIDMFNKLIRNIDRSENPDLFPESNVQDMEKEVNKLLQDEEKTNDVFANLKILFDLLILLPDNLAFLRKFVSSGL